MFSSAVVYHQLNVAFVWRSIKSQAPVTLHLRDKLATHADQVRDNRNYDEKDGIEQYLDAN